MSRYENITCPDCGYPFGIFIRDEPKQHRCPKCRKIFTR